MTSATKCCLRCTRTYTTKPDSPPICPDCKLTITRIFMLLKELAALKTPRQKEIKSFLDYIIIGPGDIQVLYNATNEKYKMVLADFLKKEDVSGKERKLLEEINNLLYR